MQPYSLQMPFAVEKTEPFNVLSPNEAVTKAYEYRSSLHAFRERTRERNYQAWAEIAGYLPQAAFHAKRSKSKNRFFAKHREDIEIRQAIFDPLIIERYAIARQEKTISQWIELLEKDAIRFETEKSILDLWTLMRKSKAIAALEESSQQEYVKARHTYAVDLLSQNEWLKSSATRAEAVADVTSYQDELSRATYTLVRSTELPFSPFLNAEDSEAFVHYSLQEAMQYSLDFYLEQARNHRKELRIKDEEIQREKYRKMLNIVFYLPTISFFTDINNIGPTKTTPSLSLWEVGLRLDWRFDGFESFFRVKASGASVAATTLEKQDTHQQIKLEVQTTYHELQEFRKDLKAAEERYAQESNEYILRKKQVEIGEISPIEFATAEQKWQQAKFTLEEQQIRTATKYRELLAKSGYPPLKPTSYSPKVDSL